MCLSFHLDVVVRTVDSVLQVEVKESEINDVVLGHLEQPLAGQPGRIILRIVGRMDDPGVRGESTAAGDRDASVADIEAARSVVYVRVESQEHLVPEARVHHRLLRVANLD